MEATIRIVFRRVKEEESDDEFNEDEIVDPRCLTAFEETAEDIPKDTSDCDMGYSSDDDEPPVQVTETSFGPEKTLYKKKQLKIFSEWDACMPTLVEV